MAGRSFTSCRFCAPASLDALWGYLDDRGGWVIEPRFQDAGAFSEGVAAVGLVGGGFRFVDLDGQWRGDAQFEEVGPHRGGLARARRGECWGYVDVRGELVIEPRFSQARDFVEGLAAVQLGEAWTWITPTGHVLCEPRYGRVFDASAGVGIFEHHGTRGFVSPSGETLAEGLESAHEFREGLAAIQLRARWGFMDTAGQLVIPPRFAGVLLGGPGGGAQRRRLGLYRRHRRVRDPTQALQLRVVSRRSRVAETVVVGSVDPGTRTVEQLLTQSSTEC